MMTSLLSTLAFTLLAAAPGDQERIQGDWKLVFRGWDRQWVDWKLTNPFTITTFRGNERTTDERGIPDTFVLHSERTPKAIELHYKDEGGRPWVSWGVYELEGDTLKLCFHFVPGKHPPPDFTCEPGPERMYWVLKRVRPDDPPEPAPAEVVIADEHRATRDPAEIKIAVTNKTDETIPVSFDRFSHMYWFGFHFFDERGRAVSLTRTKLPDQIGGHEERFWIKPGKTVIGYLSPKLDYEVPPGRYRISVSYIYHVPDKDVVRKVESNQITKTFP